MRALRTAAAHVPRCSGIVGTHQFPRSLYAHSRCHGVIARVARHAAVRPAAPATAPVDVQPAQQQHASSGTVVTEPAAQHTKRQDAGLHEQQQAPAAAAAAGNGHGGGVSGAVAAAAAAPKHSSNSGSTQQQRQRGSKAAAGSFVSAEHLSAAQQLLAEWRTLQDSRPPQLRKASAPHPDAIRLLDLSIQSADSVEQLEAILTVFQGKLLHHGLTTMTVRLSQLVRKQQQVAVDGSSDGPSTSADGSSDASTSSEITTAAAAAAAAGVSVAEHRRRWHVQSQLVELLLSHFKWLNALQVGLLLRSLSQLQCTDGALVRLLQARAKRVMPSAHEAQTLSLMVSGAVRLAGVQEAWQEQLRVRVVARSPRMRDGSSSSSSSSSGQQQQGKRIGRVTPWQGPASGSSQQQGKGEHTQGELVRSTRQRKQQQVQAQRPPPALPPQQQPAPAAPSRPPVGRPTKAFLEAWLQQSQLHLPSFTPTNLATSIHSLALAEQQPTAEWREAFLAASERLLVVSAAATAADQGSTASGSSGPGSSSSHEASTTALATSSSATTSSSPPPPAAAPHFGPSDLSMVLWSLARLNIRPSDEWFGAFRAACRSVYWVMSGPDVANLLWATGRLQLPTTEAWVKDMLWQAQRKLRGMSTQQLAGVGWALGEMRVRPAVPWVQRYCKLVRCCRCGRVGWLGAGEV